MGGQDFHPPGPPPQDPPYLSSAVWGGLMLMACSGGASPLAAAPPQLGRWGVRGCSPPSLPPSSSYCSRTRSPGPGRGRARAGRTTKGALEEEKGAIGASGVEEKGGLSSPRPPQGAQGPGRPPGGCRIAVPGLARGSPKLSKAGKEGGRREEEEEGGGGRGGGGRAGGKPRKRGGERSIQQGPPCLPHRALQPCAFTHGDPLLLQVGGRRGGGRGGGRSWTLLPPPSRRPPPSQLHPAWISPWNSLPLGAT